MSKIATVLRRFGDFRLAEWISPLLILLVCFFSFGLLLSRLGFFQDDWHHVFYAYWQGAAGLQRFLLADRGPFAWIVYAFFFRILGFSPTAWHWSLMVLRFLTAIMFWLSLRQIWPHQDGLTSWLGLLFAVYPIFTLQPLSVAYTLHWVMYLVFMLSLFLMLVAVRRPGAFIPLTALAVALEAIHLVFIEYFSGLELCRLVFLWFIFANMPTADRLKKTFKQSLPYLAVLVLYVLYRSSYASIFGYDRFTPLGTLTDLLRSPLAGLLGVLQAMLQDLLYVVFSQWYVALNPAVIDLSRPSTYFILGAILGFAAIAYLAFAWLDRLRHESDVPGLGAEVAAGGLVSIVLALIPFWLTGFSIYQKNLLWSERLALAAMPGASMLIAGAAYGLISQNLRRHLVLGVLLGLAIGLHVQTARSYQASWDKQRQFYWQLHWRAPALESNTLIVSDQEILFYMGIYPTAFSINLLYPQATPPPVASYWFNAGSEHVNFDKFAAGQLVTFDKYATTFTATVQHVVAITFEPGQDQCLWILGPPLANARSLSPQASTWLTVSNPSRILAAPETVPPPAIFGPEPTHGWCYYFETADLADQFGQWSKTVGLWREASQIGLHAGNGIELMPFITAFANSNDWETARTLTEQAQSLPDRSTSALCDLWRSLAATTAPSAPRDQAVARIEDQFGCQP
jgi:hypothetical protein